MIEIWMKVTWLVTIIATLLIYNPPKNLQGMTNNVGLAISIGVTMSSVTILVLS